MIQIIGDEEIDQSKAQGLSNVLVACCIVLQRV